MEKSEKYNLENKFLEMEMQNSFLINDDRPE